ncbi:unnamed protein product [Rhizophagus irregularis]|nr:unnamed protein product [Rhizophagus irregularis]
MVGQMDSPKWSVNGQSEPLTDLISVMWVPSVRSSNSPKSGKNKTRSYPFFVCILLDQLNAFLLPLQTYQSQNFQDHYLKLMRKDIPYKWSNKQQKTFKWLKQCLTKDPILSHPNFEKEFILITDASADGLGAILA